MAETEGRSMPKALMATVKRFAGQRKRVRLTLSSGSTTAGANDILRIRLPSNSLVDLGSFCVNGTLAVDAGHRVYGTHTLIRRLGMVAGGLNINYQSNVWGLVAHASNVAGNGLAFDEGNCVASMNPLDFQTNGDIVALNYFPNSPLQAGCCDTGLLGECEVDIAFAGAEASIADNGTTPAGTWSLSGIKAYVDVIELEDDSYRKGVAAMLQSGRTYEKTMPLATAVVQDGTGSNNFNVSTGCLDKVMVVPKDTNYLQRAASGTTEAYNRYLNGVADADSKVYVQIGSQSFPQYGYNDNWKEIADITRQSEGGASTYNYNKLFLTKDSGALKFNADAFVTQNAIASIQVGAFHPETGKEHGIDLSSGNSVIRVETSDLPTNSKLLMVAFHTSKLIAKAGQVVAFKA